MATPSIPDTSIATAVSARVNGERLVLLGWSRAILMQVSHPLVAAGVAGHSAFRANPIASARRLHHTVRAMLALTFGSDVERGRTIDEIRAIHRRVRGVLPRRVGPYPAGTAYSAEDPALVLWVHLTIVESSILAYESIVSPLASDERDAYCRAAASVAMDLGARESDVPLSWPALTGAVSATVSSGALHVGDDARAIASAVLRGGLSAALWPAAWINRRVTAGWLPPTLRDAYEFSWGERDVRALDRAIRYSRLLRRSLPGALARWPHARGGPA